MWGTSAVCTSFPPLLQYVSVISIIPLSFDNFHFADDTCLVDIESTITKINRILNKELKELSFFLNTNKIALNLTRKKVKLFKTK